MHVLVTVSSITVVYHGLYHKASTILSSIDGIEINHETIFLSSQPLSTMSIKLAARI